MNRDDKELQIASCRLVLDILPGLETSVVFNDTVSFHCFSILILLTHLLFTGWTFRKTFKLGSKC